MPLPLVPLLLGGGAVAAAAVGGTVVHRRREKARIAAWQKVAADVGGTFLPAEGFLRHIPARIDAAIGDARIFLDSYTQSTGQSSVTYYRCRATMPLAAGPRFRIYPENALAILGKAFGFRDVVLGGHTRFDELFIVRCDDEDRVRTMWTRRAKELLCEFKHAQVKCDGPTITFETHGDLRDAGTVRTVVELVAELTNCDFYGRETLAAIEGARYRATRGPWNERSRPEAILDLPNRVTIGPERVFSESLRTVARLGGTAPHGDLAATVGELAASGRATLPPAARPHLHGLDPEIRLLIDRGSAALVWPSVASDPEALRRGAEMLATFAVASEGAFR